jgi:hypothetical protein
MIVFALSCRLDKLEPCPTVCASQDITYTNYIKNLVDNSCAFVGCHDGNTAGTPGNYGTYQALEGIIASGKFKSRVLDVKDMPKGFLLSSGQLDSIKCWLCNGHPN